jgi:N-methylhydantoinase A
MGAVASDVAVVEELSAPMRLARTAGGSDVDDAEVEAVFARLEGRARAEVAAQGVSPGDVRVRRIVEMRFTRQTKALPVPYPGSVPRLLDDFLAAYARRYGAAALPELAGVELVTFAVEARGALGRPEPARFPPRARGTASPDTTRPVYDPVLDAFADTPIFDAERLATGDALHGPAIVVYPGTTLVVVTGQHARVDEFHNVSIRSVA